MKKSTFIICLILILIFPVFMYAQQASDLTEEEQPAEKSGEESPGNKSRIDENDALYSVIEDPLQGENDTDDSGTTAFIDDPFKVDGDDTDLETTESGKEAVDEGELIPADDPDAMFSDDMFEELDETAQDTAPHEALLKSEGVTWGGKFSGAVDSLWEWNIFDPAGINMIEPSSASIDPTVNADLYFNARPEKDFRVYGKLKIQSGTQPADFSGLLGLTITQDPAGNIIINTGTPQPTPAAAPDANDPDTPDDDSNDEQPDADPDYNSDDDGLPQDPAEDEEDTTDEEDGQPGNLTLSLSVFELFADFSWKDLLFFRFGKHTIKWGVGYFWSPADVLNLTPIDTEDPAAEREGPLSLKTHFPFSVHNAYLYLIANRVSEPLDIAVASKAEFVLGNSEIGIGAFYQRDLAPRLVSMVKSSVADFDLFGEVVMSFGSDRVFVKKSRNQSQAEANLNDDLEVVLDTYEDKYSLFFSGTAGFLYTNSGWNLNIIAQYFYNSEGYGNSQWLTSAYYLTQNADANGLYIADEADRPDDYADPPVLTINDLTNFGQHYAAISFMFTKLFGIEDLGFSLFLLANISDFSGIITPSVSYKFFNRFNLNMSVRATFGDAGDELTNPAGLAGNILGLASSDEEAYRGATVSLALKLSIGSGSF